MDASVVAAAVSGAGVVLSTMVSYFITRSKNRKEIAVNEKNINAKLSEQLTDEQKELRKEMREELKQMREEMNLWRDRSFKLEDKVQMQELEINQWKQKYNTMEMENIYLREQLQEMNTKLKRMYEKNNSE